MALIFMDAETLANMKSRVRRCRELARSTTDERTARILLQMADEGQADIDRLEAERARASSPPDQGQGQGQGRDSAPR